MYLLESTGMKRNAARNESPSALCWRFDAGSCILPRLPHKDSGWHCAVSSAQLDGMGSHGRAPTSQVAEAPCSASQAQAGHRRRPASHRINYEQGTAVPVVPVALSSSYATPVYTRQSESTPSWQLAVKTAVHRRLLRPFVSIGVTRGATATPVRPTAKTVCALHPLLPRLSPASAPATQAQMSRRSAGVRQQTTTGRLRAQHRLHLRAAVS